jgi:fibronectin-binding autotransporter adhesin
MPTQIQLRRGTYAQHQSFTGATAEPTFDTSNKVMRIHDGTTPGGLEQVPGNTLYKSTAVRVIATSNITLAGVQTIDGVSLSPGDRVLVAGQTDQAKNGIYVVVDLPGTWTRAFDFDKILNIQKGMVIYVGPEGSTHNDTVWKVTSQPTTLELHAITFEKWLGVETRGLAQNTVSGLVTRTAKGAYTGRAVTVSGQGITVTNGDGVSGNPLLSLNSTPNNTASAIMARDGNGDYSANNATLAGDIAVNGGDVTTTAATASLFNANATTVNIGSAATAVSIGATTGTTTVRNDLVVTGTFTVNGTTETINAVTVTVDDKNIELGSVASPSNTTADGGGITLKGTTDKTINWSNATGAWTSSEDFSLVTGKTYEINAIPVLTANSVLNDATQTSITIGGSATAISLGAATGTLTINNPTVVGANATQNLYNTVATTINAFGAATTLNIGTSVAGAQTTNIATGATASANTKVVNLGTGGLAGSTTNVNIGSTAGGLLTINNPNITVAGGTMNFTNATDATTSTNGSVNFAGGIGVAKNIVCDGTFSIFGDISVNGGDILTNQSTVSVFNSVATTANLLAAASTVTIGASGGTTTLRSGTLVGTDATQNLYNTVATTLNIGGAATAINLGNATGATLTVRPGTVVGANSTQSVFDSVATTVNAFGAATTLTLGNATGATATIRPGTVVGANSTQDLWNTVATTVNFAGAATSLNIGAASGLTRIKNNLEVDGDVQIDGGDLTVSTTTFNLANTTATTLNMGGAATVVNIGASTGNTTVNNNLIVSGNLTVNGTTTTINSTTLSVDDLNIVLADGAASAAAANGAGLTVAGANATLTYGSANDRWEMNKSLSITGTAAVSSNATVGGTLGVTGATTLSSTLAVSSNTTVGGTLGVTGTSTFTGLITSSNGISGGPATHTTGSFSSTLGVSGATTLSSTLNVSGAVTLSSSLSAGSTSLSSLTLSNALPIASGGTAATTAQGARTNLLPAQSAGQNGYVLTTNGSDVFWNYLGNAMVTSFNGRTNVVTLTSGDVTGALGYTPLNGGNTSTQTITFGSLEIAAGGMLKGTAGNWTGEHNKIQWHSSHLYLSTINGGNWIFRTNGGEPAYITNAGVVYGSGHQVTSDISLKENVETIDNASELLNNLRGVTFDWKSTKKRAYGFIAQEVEATVPELVEEMQVNSMEPEKTVKTVDYDKVVSILVEGWKEQQARIEALEAEVKALKGE